MTYRVRVRGQADVIAPVGGEVERQTVVDDVIEVDRWPTIETEGVTSIEVESKEHER
jgi:hypothetical protein